MSEKFIKIGITHPEPLQKESQKIADLLISGNIDFMHIRKPAMDEQDLKTLVNKLPRHLHHKLKIHNHFKLIYDFNLGGIHISSSYKEIPLIDKNQAINKDISISKSMHIIEELTDSSLFDYVFLSPIFDSISKEGYFSPFNLNEISRFITNKNVVALGGVTPEKFPLLKEKGFYGAAMLGYLWN